MRNDIVTNKQAGFEFYLRLVRFTVQYTQKLLLRTDLENTYFVTAQGPVFNQCLDRKIVPVI